MSPTIPKPDNTAQAERLMARAERIERDAVRADGPARDQALQTARGLRREAARLRGNSSAADQDRRQAEALRQSRARQAAEMQRIRALADKLRGNGGGSGAPAAPSAPDPHIPVPSHDWRERGWVAEAANSADLPPPPRHYSSLSSYL